MKKLLTSIFGVGLLSVCALWGAPAQAETIKAVTASLPPFTVSPEKKGITHEMVEEISKRSGVDIEIEYLPWSRAQVVAQETPNTLIFTIGRSEAREPKYTWIAQLAESNTVFATVGEKVDSLEAGKNLSAITVLANTPREKKLAGEGFTNFTPQQKVELCARMLNGGRVDAWYTLDVRATYVFKEYGLDTSKLVFGEPTSVLPLWLAGNLEFDAEVADKIKAAVESMKADGTVDAIKAKYL